MVIDFPQLYYYNLNAYKIIEFFYDYFNLPFSLKC